MGRVRTSNIEKLNRLIEVFGDDAVQKCSLCTTTLTHLVKQCEVKANVPLATTANAIADKINETALPQDRVTGGQLRDRVRRHEGKVIVAKHPNKPTHNTFYNSKEEQDADIERNLRDYKHFFDPIEALSTCPISALELYQEVPGRQAHNFNNLQSAHDFLTELLEVHNDNSE